LPRKAPDTVQEIRITGGTYERNLLAPILAAKKQEIMIQNIRSGVVGLAGIVTVGAIGYFGIQAYGLAAGVSDDLQSFLTRMKGTADTVVFGPESVKTKKPPSQDGRVDFLRDPEDPMKRINPAHGIPAVGPLFGFGMAIGEKLNPTDPSKWMEMFDIGRGGFR